MSGDMIWYIWYYDVLWCDMVQYIAWYIWCGVVSDGTAWYGSPYYDMFRYQYPILGKTFTGPTYTFLLSFTVISDLYRSFITNKTTFIKYCFTQWISKLPGSFEIHRFRPYPVNSIGLVGMVNATVYKTKPIIPGHGHDKLAHIFSIDILWNRNRSTHTSNTTLSWPVSWYNDIWYGMIQYDAMWYDMYKHKH